MKEYLLILDEIRDSKKADKVEAVVRDYLFSQADKIRLTQKKTRFGLLFKKIGYDDDPKFQQTLKNLQDDFFSKETDNELFHLDQHKGKVFNHYYYKFSPKIKDIINKLTLIWMFEGPDHKSPFYGFEDPSFYKDEKLITHVVSHERMIYLYLDEDLLNDFKRQLDVTFYDTAEFVFNKE